MGYRQGKGTMICSFTEILLPAGEGRMDKARPGPPGKRLQALKWQRKC